HRAVLLRAVVVERDRPGADVHALSDLGVADVAEVMHLRSGPQARVLDLAEVTHLDAALEICARSEVRVGAAAYLVFERRALGRRVLDLAALPHRGVAQDGVGSDTRTGADRGLPFEDGA